MFTPVSIEQIRQLQGQLAAGQISEVYATLSNSGYAYADWAKGVANGDTVAGIAALDYLKGTALMGAGGPQCQNLSAETVQNIRQGMAEAYLATLANIASNSGTG